MALFGGDPSDWHPVASVGWVLASVFVFFVLPVIVGVGAVSYYVFDWTLPGRR